MLHLISLEELIVHVTHDELSQVAGIGSHNTSEGRTLDEDKIDKAIAFASDMARGYMMRRFPQIATIAQSEVPPLVKGYVGDIARYRLRGSTGNRNTTSDEVEQRFKDARSWFQEVSRGLINVDFGDGAADPSSATDPMRKVRTSIPDARAPGILAGWHS
jgi:phage gp36-like protein